MEIHPVINNLQYYPTSLIAYKNVWQFSLNIRKCTAKKHQFFWPKCLRDTFYNNQAHGDSDHLRFCYFSFILFRLYLLLNCENFLRRNPVVAELRPLKHLPPGGKIFKIDFFSFLSSSVFSCKHWHIGVIGSCEYMTSLLTQTMNLGVLVFA